MTARLTRLRIAGFKSFAEPVSLDILPGLTGIVGPNGCGKSNVVVALRWAMGETSARSLRGGEMDDVIFAGTTARPSRNLAEVTITLERAGTEALPSPFEAESELQLTRRIERGAGSGYRGNGREMRARDVQTMFADLASGARASAMVSQGKVAAIVNARPEERRQILEEAAGITGLHARRHEAELKLRAAEANLAKAEDARTQLEATREGLRKQARQAARYRNISGLVRAAEAELLAVQHAVAAAVLAEARDRRQAALSAVAIATAACELAERQAAEAEAGLAAPRDIEAASRSALERARLEQEGIAREADQAAQALAEAVRRVEELRADAADALRADEEWRNTCMRLRAESEALQARRLALPADMAASREAVAEAEARARETQLAADAAMRRAADAAAQAAQAQRARAAAVARAAEANSALRQAEADHADAERALIPEADLRAATSRVQAAGRTLEQARECAAAASTTSSLAARDMALAESSLERARTEASHACQARDDAAMRLARIEAALIELTEAAALAQADLVPKAAVTACRDAAREAGEALERSEARVQAAERDSIAAAQAHVQAARAAQSAAEDAAQARLRCETAAARLAGLTTEADTLLAQLAEAEAALLCEDDIAPLEAEAAAAEAAFTAWEQALRDIAALRLAEEADLAARRAETARFRAEAARLAAEIQGMKAALAAHGGSGPAASDLLDVPEGLEAAIGAALEGTQDFAVSAEGERIWRVLPAGNSPESIPGTTRLDRMLAVPDCLKRRFSRVAVLDEAEEGDTLHLALAPGDMLVSRAGAAWCWDGRVVRAGAPNAASIRLRQRRRLRDAETAEIAAESAAGQAQSSEAAAAERLATVIARSAAMSQAREEADLRWRAARDAHAARVAEAGHAAARHAALKPAAARAVAERDAASGLAEESRLRSANLPAPEAARVLAEAARAQAGIADQALETARRERQAARTRAMAEAEALRAMETSRDAAAHRLESLDRQIAPVRAERAAAEAALAQARTRLAALPDTDAMLRDAEAARLFAETAAADWLEAREAQDRAQAELDSARAASAALETARVAAETRWGAEQARLARAKTDHDSAHAAFAEADAAVLSLAGADTLSTEIDAACALAAEARDRLAAAQAEASALLAEFGRAEARAPGLLAELNEAEIRQTQAASRVAAFASRLEAAVTAQTALEDAPARFASRAAAHEAALEDSRRAHEAAAASLAQAEADRHRSALARRDADQNLAARRETLVRLESTEAASQACLDGVVARAAERLGADTPLPAPDDISAAAEEKTRRKWERLQREREEMGPVNLRADIELQDIEQKLGDIGRDRDELTTAIAKLRGAIGYLNREGRERLAAVFTDVDRHFRALFTRMMGGGRAHLALTGSDDPLLAGLEIYAEPPGKKLATLSLLSGGEQALTALSLIFAVFRCTPAPVAVLDEVDAPLDDANVDRFCALLEDVVRETGTRFLVVTHHQVTMSRMDRLFGVTMQERGVSRLLSVDLRRAAEMVEATPQAAAA
jgi:chromosome segregation protein